MLARVLRATGADLPFGDLRGAHPGVALESWFWRIVGPEPDRVRLVICTVCRDEDTEPWAAVALVGVGPHVRAEAIVEDVVAAPDRLDVRVGDVLHATAGRLRFEHDDAQLDLGIEPGAAWPRRRHGGLGLAHLVPGLTQYWHPHLLGARASDGGLVYGEKNWGRGGAPRAWWWGQASAGPEVAVAFAGGVLDAGPLGVPATALAARVGEELVSFAPPLGLVRVDAGAGEWRVVARSAAATVKLEGETAGLPLDLPVPVPRERRTLPLSHQHQAGSFQLEVRRGRRLLVRTSGDAAGFEHGGAAGTRAAA